MSFFSVFQKLYKGTTGFEPGTSRTAAKCSTTELYPRCIQFQYHHCKHVQVVWALLQCFLFQVKCTLAINVIFSSLSKIIQGDTRARTRDLSDCSWMLYHWAISPLHTDSIPSLQTRAGCLSTVTMFFVPIQVFSRDRCHFSLSFKIYTRGHPGSNQGPLGLQPNALPLSYIPAAYSSNTITANTCMLFEHCYNVFCSESSVLSRSITFFSSLSKNNTRGHPGSNQGPLGLQPNALPLSYVPAAYRLNNITANTLRLFEHCYNVFCSESSVLSRSMSFFSSRPKIIQGDTRVRTRDLSDCNPMLYHWAISPLQTDSIPSLQTRAGCLSTVTMFFVPSQVFSRDR